MMDATRAIQAAIARADLVIFWALAVAMRWYIRLPVCFAIGVVISKAIMKRNESR